MPTDRVIEDCITKMEQGRSGKNSDADRYNFWPPCLWNTAQKVVAEIVGTYFMIFAGCGSVAVNKMYGGSVTFPGICITWGLIVTVLIYTLGHVSGAHFNPVVTITNAVFGRMPYWEVPAYIIAQLLGSILSSGTLRLALDAKAEHFFGTNPAGSDVQSFVFETVITFLLLFVVTSVATDNRAVGELGGIAIGSTIVLNVFVAGPISGASMNPARTLGPAIVMNNYKGLWVYIAGPLIGALAGSLSYNFLRASDKPQDEQTTKAPSFLSN